MTTDRRRRRNYVVDSGNHLLISFVSSFADERKRNMNVEVKVLLPLETGSSRERPEV